MDRFIQEQRGTGAAEPGQFTLNPSKAREKLREFQLARPSFYILKLIQAGIAAGSPQVEVKLSRHWVQVSFAPRCLQSDVDVSRLLEVLDDLNTQEPVSRHLGVGLNASLAVDPKKVTYSVEGPMGGQELVITGTGVQVGAPTEPRQELRCRFVLEKSRGFKELFRSIFSRTMEHRAIYERCRFTDRLWLDGRLPESGWDRSNKPYEAAWTQYMTQPYVLLERYLTGPGRSLDTGSLLTKNFRRDSGRWLSNSFKLKWVLALTTDSEIPVIRTSWGSLVTLLREFVDPNGAVVPADHPFVMALRWPVSLTGPTVIHFIKHGVALDPVKVDLGAPGLEVVCSADELEVDLSEFGVVQNEDYRGKLEQIKEQALSMAATIYEYEEKWPLAFVGGNEHQIAMYLKDVHKGITKRLPRPR